MASGSIDLAGVIGTWVAVLFAIIALVGIVGPIFVYRNLQSQRTIALNSTDDFNHTYIGRGIRTWKKNTRTLRRIKAPFLNEPPELANIHCNKRSQRLQSRISATGWINFSNLLHSYGID